MKYIDSEKMAEKLRRKLVRLNEKKILLAQLNETDEAKDSYTNVNCEGYGRVRSFSKYSLHLRNALKKEGTPIKPLLRGHEKKDKILSQAFQIAGCNWLCWYCFVDSSRRVGSLRDGKYFSADQILDMCVRELDNLSIIDLTGGQPDLVPEWSLWMMEEIEKRKMRDKVYLWIDDNLSSDYFWKFLNDEQIEYMKNFPKYSRAGCFKGFSEESFSFNTSVRSSLFQRQFEIFERFMRNGFDMYAYATFTGEPIRNIKEVMSIFVDRLQKIHHNLPLRTIPLKVSPFSANKQTINDKYLLALNFQYVAYEAWNNELQKRFKQNEIDMAYEDVDIS